MGSKLLFFVAGMVVGGLVCVLALGKKANHDTALALATANVAHSNEITEAQSTLAASQSHVDKLRSENVHLAAQVQKLQKKQRAADQAAKTDSPKRSGLAALFGGDGTNGMSEAMSGMMKSAIEQQMEGKISAMKNKLKLTPEQETAIRDILAKQMGKGVELAQKMFKGGATKEELAETGKNSGNERDQIKALLTPEQLTAYDEYENEEKSRMARLVANSELMQMQTSLNLTEEQQDKVFAILAERAQNQFDPASMASSGFDFRKLSEQKVDALRGVLTPEQIERYQKAQEQQLKLIESLIKTRENGGSGAIK